MAEDHALSPEELAEVVATIQKYHASNTPFDVVFGSPDLGEKQVRELLPAYAAAASPGGWNASVGATRSLRYASEYTRGRPCSSDGSSNFPTSPIGKKCDGSVMCSLCLVMFF